MVLQTQWTYSSANVVRVYQNDYDSLDKYHTNVVLLEIELQHTNLLVNIELGLGLWITLRYGELLLYRFQFNCLQNDVASEGQFFNHVVQHCNTFLI